VVEFTPVDGVVYKHDYVGIFEAVAGGRIPEQNVIYYYRELAKNDLFFLLYFGLERSDVNRPFIIEAIAEVEACHNNTIDLWAREHYKSTILTYALILQELIRNPEERIAIFSHTRPIAKGFLRLIKNTLQDHPPLKRWFSDVFFSNPTKEAPKWSEDDGLVVKRRTHSAEASLEAWGMVDGQPTSKHFTVRVYDDVVTKESVTNPEQISKVLEAYELSQSLGTDGGRERIVGTHYHYADLYAVLKKRPEYIVREKPATDDGTRSGKPVLLSRERLDELRRKQGVYVFSCQQLLRPVSDEDQKFRGEWIRYYDKLPDSLNYLILVDPANEKKKKSDYTVMVALGIDRARNWFLLNMVRDKLNLKERWKALYQMHLEYPDAIFIGYEQYGMQADITYHEEKQQEVGAYFTITPMGGNMSKEDRILRLVPVFQERRFYLPRKLYYRDQNLVEQFIEDEYLMFPFVTHDDMLDCIARIMDDVPELTPTSRMTAAESRRLREKNMPPMAA
jgi:phage terminase large subunit-like protein